MSDSGVDCVESTQRRGDAVGPFPDIVKYVVFKIEKLTERVHRPKAPAALPQPKMCHLLARRSMLFVSSLPLLNVTGTI